MVRSGMAYVVWLKADLSQQDWPLPLVMNHLQLLSAEQARAQSSADPVLMNLRSLPALSKLG